MSEIDKLRKQIDKIDLDLLKAINRRSQIAIKIGSQKKSTDLFRPNRQADILRKIFIAKFNTLSPNMIFSFWRNLFFSQINLQGGISVVTLKGLKKIFLTEIYDYFTHDIKISFLNSFKKMQEKVILNENKLLILPYPSNKNKYDWWIKYKFDKTYIVTTLPFLINKKKKPNLVVISKYIPEVKVGNDLFYKSEYKIKDSRLNLEASGKKYYLYKTNFIIKDLDIQFIGSSPKRYETKS